MGENSSDWIDAGLVIGVDLSGLYEDKRRMVDMLDRLGLSRHKDYYISEDQINSDFVETLFSHTACFCRLIPRSGGRRPYRERISSAEEFRAFCSEYNLSNYDIHLVEKPGLEYTGGIIANEFGPGIPMSCAIEIVRGDGHALFHGKEIPIHADVDFDRVVKYSGHIEPTEEERRIVYRALHMIGGPGHPFPGYYEFDVLAEGEIKFRNYQNPCTPYATTSFSRSLKKSPIADLRK